MKDTWLAASPENSHLKAVFLGKEKLLTIPKTLTWTGSEAWRSVA